MKGHTHMRVRAPSKVSTQQVIFELKQKVVVALNKLADRDTYQIGADELEKTAEYLTPDGIAPFLSCILDTDSEQKSAVRKECIRLMGTLARFHEGLIRPHLVKMVASVIKRLKDPDSVVRDACVETVGVLSSKLSDGECDRDGAFVVLVKPLFEALGEQNKQVQSGSALCLARIIENTHSPPVSILQRMLTRTIKLLKNPHFMAKAAVIELNRSIIQAGGAPSQHVQSAVMTSIQDALKDSDWATRKAASVALAEIASSGGSFLGSFKASCIRSLESCRFDKVKPVRDTILNALQFWRSLPGMDTPEPSETGSSIKENFCGAEFSDMTSISDSGLKDVALKKAVMNSAKRRSPLSVRKPCQNYTDDPRNSKAVDWHIEIAVPKAHNVGLADLQNEESEGSSVTKMLERMSADVNSTQDMGYEYVPMDDKQECSSVSNLVADNFETKFVSVSQDCPDDFPMRRNRRFAIDEISSGAQICSEKMHDRRSLDSMVTECSVQPVGGCCSHLANEMVCIRKQLSEIENKQSNLMDLLQVFSTGIMDSLTMLQSKVLGLEHVVDRLSQDLIHGGRHPDVMSSKCKNQSQSLSSARLSTCTPRPSVDVCNRQPSLLSVRSCEIWEENALGRSRSSNFSKQGTESWTSPMPKVSRNIIKKETYKNLGQGMQRMGKIKRNDPLFGSTSVSNGHSRQYNSEGKSGIWQRVKAFLSEGDFDSAYVEALCSCDELVLIELLDRTGPVLENLSDKTVSDLLSTLASHFLDQRFRSSFIPWLMQATGGLEYDPWTKSPNSVGKNKARIIVYTSGGHEHGIFLSSRKKIYNSTSNEIASVMGKLLLTSGSEKRGSDVEFPGKDVMCGDKSRSI